MSSCSCTYPRCRQGYALSGPNSGRCNWLSISCQVRADADLHGALRSTCHVARNVSLWHDKSQASVGDGGRHWEIMKNGLYSIHVSVQYGSIGKGSVVVLFRDVKIVGGDA